MNRMKKTKADLLKKIHGGQVCQIIATTARLGLADLLLHEPKSTTHLASELHVDTSVLQRLISSLVALYLLEEVDGRYQLTAEGRHLAKDDEHSVHALAVYKGSPFVWEAHGKLFEGMKTGATPFECAHGEDLFSHLEKNEEHLTIYHGAMASYEHQSSPKILNLYDFHSCSHFLDVGGGLGGFARRIIDKYPNLKGAVFDRPSVTKLAKNDHVQFIPGDFFEHVPKGYDTYILRNILHDWSDKNCLRLLNNLRKACENQAKVLIFETFYNRSHQSRLGKFSDLTMFTLTPGGQERTFDEITDLLQRSGFQITNAFQTTSSKSLIEASC